MLSARQTKIARRLLTTSTRSLHIHGTLVGKNPSSIEPGDFAAVEIPITEKKVVAFADLTGDHNPIHLDEEVAKQSRFKQRIAHGFLFASAIPAVFACALPGAVYLKQTMKFVSPVYFEEVVRTTISVVRLEPKPRGIGTVIECTTVCEVKRNNSYVKVVDGLAEVLVPPTSPK